MFTDMKDYWQQLKRPIIVGKRLEQNLDAFFILGAVIALIGVITTYVNIIQVRGSATYATVGIIAVGISVMYAARILKSRRACCLISMIIIIVFFTVFALIGVNDGFAITWSVIVPISVGYFISARAGILFGIYYELLYIVLFYTPVRSVMAQYYSKTLMDRFPILFFCVLAVSALSMTQYHLTTLRQMEYEENLEGEVQRQTKKAVENLEKLERISIQAVEALADSIDAKDPYTNGHSRRVSHYSMLIGEKAGMDDSELEILRMEALLHDVGKIGVPDGILKKPGKLTGEEYEIIKGHTVTGGEILSDMELMPGAADVARHHHERYDGEGYPDGLAGTAVSDHSRIVAVADSYDAMSSDRVYRKRLEKETIIDEIKKGRGYQFDPVYADIMLELITEGAV